MKQKNYGIYDDELGINVPPLSKEDRLKMGKRVADWIDQEILKELIEDELARALDRS